MSLRRRFLALVRESVEGTFAQGRSRQRAEELLLGSLCAFGRRTVSRSICAVGRQDQDWSADYKLYSRSPWEADRQFAPVVKDYLRRHPTGPIVAAMDDTKYPKSGAHVPGASWHRDPLSPPFHTNLLFGQRFIQISLLFPLHEDGEHAARAIPVRFVESPVVKKPGKRASAEAWAAYRQARRRKNLSTDGVAALRALRAELDAAGAAERLLLVSVDGSWCNRTVFRAEVDRIVVVARARKDAVLCWPAPPGSRRTYDERTFTPEEVRGDAAVPWKVATVFYGGCRRTIRYKELSGVLWRGGAGKQPLRLLVVAPQPYRRSPNARRLYHEAAYLLTRDLTSRAEDLLQAYLDRWQIEVNHRDEKDIFGVGQAQVWSTRSVPRQPAFVVAGYALLLLAALQEFGPQRPAACVPLPKWRRNAKRPSALDLLTLLRKEIHESQDSSSLHRTIASNTVAYAYT